MLSWQLNNYLHITSMVNAVGNCKADACICGHWVVMYNKWHQQQQWFNLINQTENHFQIFFFFLQLLKQINRYTCHCLTHSGEKWICTDQNGIASTVSKLCIASTKFVHIQVHSLLRQKPGRTRSWDLLPISSDPYHLIKSQNKATVLSCILENLLIKHDRFCGRVWMFFDEKPTQGLDESKKARQDEMMLRQTTFYN